MIGTLAKQAAGFISIGAAVAGVIRVARESVELARQQEQAEAKLAAVLTATGEAAGFNQGQLERMASGLQSITTFGDEAIIEMQSLLLTFKGIQGPAFERTTSLALDLSAAFGQDLKSSAIQLGKALEDPSTGLTALNRIGVSFTQEQENMIKALQAGGDVAAAQGIILDTLEGQVGGVASAMADTAAGEAEQFKNAIGDLKEVFGGFIDEALRPVRDELTQLATSLTTMKAAAEGLAALGEDVGAAWNSESYEQLNGVLDETSSQLEAARAELEGVQEQIDDAGFFTSQTKLTALAQQRAAAQERIALLSATEAELISQIEELGAGAAEEAERRADAEERAVAAQQAAAAEAQRIAGVVATRNAAQEEYNEKLRQTDVLLQAGIITEEDAARRGQSAARTFAEALVELGYDGIGEQIGDQLLQGLRSKFEEESPIDPMVQQAQNALAMLADTNDHYNQVMIDSDEAAAEKRKAIEANLQAARESIIGSSFEFLNALTDASIEDERKRAIAQKAIAIAEATVNTAVAVSKLLANPPAAIAASIAGAAQIATIAATPIPAAQMGGSFQVPPGNNADGGLVRVNSGEQVDVTPARQSGGGQPITIRLNLGGREWVAAVEDVFNKNGGQIRNANAVRTR